MSDETTTNAIVLDELGTLALAKYNETVETYNAQAVKVAAVDTLENFTAQFLGSAPELAEENAHIEELEQQLETWLGKRLVKATPLITPAYKQALDSTGVDMDKLNDLKKKITVTAKYLTGMFGDDVIKDSPKVETLNLKKDGNTGGTVTTGTSGGRRIHGFDVYVDGQLTGVTNAEGKIKSSFTSAARVLKCETTELQRAFFEEAASEDYKDSSFPSVVEFNFKDHVVKCVKVGDSDDTKPDDTKNDNKTNQE